MGNVQLDQSAGLGSLNLVSFIIDSQSDLDIDILAGLSIAAAGLTVTAITAIVPVLISNTKTRILVFFT